MPQSRLPEVGDSMPKCPLLQGNLGNASTAPNRSSGNGLASKTGRFYVRLASGATKSLRDKQLARFLAGSLNANRKGSDIERGIARESLFGLFGRHDCGSLAGDSVIGTHVMATGYMKEAGLLNPQ